MVSNCPYELGRVLGDGGMATVYHGAHRETGREAAVKVGKHGLQSVPRLTREVEAMQLLDHTHVMPVLEIGRDRTWYAMPIADDSLQKLYERGMRGHRVIRSVLGAMSGALMHAHSNGFIHRDVSPGNVLKGRNGHWMLSDFGLVLPTKSKRTFITRPEARIGTKFFSAPEVHADPSSATPAADAWSIGAIASRFTNTNSQAVRHHEPDFWQVLVD